MRILQPLSLREEEKREVFAAVFEQVSDALLHYDHQTKARLRRLMPLQSRPEEVQP